MTAWPIPEGWQFIALAVVAGVILGVAVTFLWRWYRQHRERERRRRRIEAVSLDHLRDVCVPDGSGGVMHIDYLLLTPRGLLLLDMRDIPGNVFGSDAMVEWTVMQGARRFTLLNPQSAMYDRIAALKLLAGGVPVDGRIVFGAGSVFPKGLPRMTLREESLEAEFPLLDRTQGEQLVEVWREVWNALRTGLVPSEFGGRR